MYCYLDGFPGWKKAGLPTETMQDFLPSFDVPSISAAQFKALLDENGALALDIRDDEDRAMGSIKGSLFITLEDLMADQGKIPKGIAIVVVDLRGAQSPIAGRYLVKQEFGKVSRLDGGFSAWAAAGLPVEK